MFTPFIVASAILSAQDQPVELARKFKAGEKLHYAVRSHMIEEQKQYNLPYFLPNEIDLNYDFFMDFKELKADGFALMEYRRPTMTQIIGETAELPPQKSTEKVDMKYSLTISPTNEITGVKDLNPPKPEKPAAALRTVREIAGVGPRISQIDLSQFIGELQRLSLFIGSLDSSMDFNPKLPFEEVKVGDTWKKTVSYQPQVLKGKQSSAVQRLDYVYTYDGTVSRNGKEFVQITATLKLDTDAAPWMNQMMGGTAGQTGLKGVKLKLDAKIVFSLDPKTLHTINAEATSKGSWNIEVTELPNDPYIEAKLEGKTSMNLVSAK